MNAMRKAFAEQELVFPDGFDDEPRGRFFGIRTRMHYGRGSNSISVVQGTSRLESTIDMAKAAVRQAGIAGDSTALTPRSYIAIVDRPEEISLGFEGVAEQQGFHIIRGVL